MSAYKHGRMPQASAVADAKRAGYLHLLNPAAGTTTGAGDQLDVEAAAGGEVVANLVQPLHPRNLVLNFTDSGVEISAFQVDVVGVAPDGSAVAEQFLFAGGLDQVGSKVYASVTSVTLTSITETGATAKTLDIGYGTKFGVPVPANTATLVVHTVLVAGAVDSASAVDQTNNSFTPTTAADGAKEIEVCYSYEDPTLNALLAALRASTNSPLLAT